MRKQKIRGHNRLQKQIGRWQSDNITLRQDLLERYEKDHIDIVVHPWCDISIINSIFPEPNKQTKRKILTGLLDIYDSLKLQLDALGKPYYLKIWLFEPRFSKSQVVWAVGNKIEFYTDTFYKPNSNKWFRHGNYSQLKSRLEKLNWEYRLDEDHYDNTTVGEPELYSSQQNFAKSKRWFEKLIKKEHRTSKFPEPVDEIDEYYSFKRGDVWIGGQ